MTPTATIQLRVIPSAKRFEIVGRYGEAWKIRVTSAPEKGRANKEIIVQLSKLLDLPRANIEVIRGHNARDKVITVQGLAASEIEQLLAV